MLENYQELSELLGLFDISMSVVIAALLFGVIGMWLYAQGRKKQSRRFKVIGLLLMFYPYVVPGAWANWIVGTLLCGYAFYWWD
jgi:hypothetical protein